MNQLLSDGRMTIYGRDVGRCGTIPILVVDHGLPTCRTEQCPNRLCITITRNVTKIVLVILAVLVQSHLKKAMVPTLSRQNWLWMGYCDETWIVAFLIFCSDWLRVFQTENPHKFAVLTLKFSTNGTKVLRCRFYLPFPYVPGTINFQILNWKREGRGCEEVHHISVGVVVTVVRRVYPRSRACSALQNCTFWKVSDPMWDNRSGYRQWKSCHSDKFVVFL